MSALTAQRLRKSLPHLNLTRTIFTVAAGGLLIQQILEEPSALDALPRRAALGSDAYVAYGLELVIILLAITVWWAPRVSFLTGTLTFSWLALHAEDYRLGWLLLAIVSAFGLARTLLSDIRAAPTGPIQPLPKVDRFNATPAGERTVSWYLHGVAGLLCLIAIPVLLLWHESDVRDVAQFESNARTVEGIITSFDDAEEWVTVEYGGKSAELEWWFPVGTRSPGDRIDLLVAGDRVELADDPGDPSWMLGVAAAAPSIAAAVLGEGPLREWRRRRLLRRGGRQTAVRVVTYGDEVTVLPVNADAPCLRLNRPRGLDPSWVPEAEWEDDCDDEEWDDEDWQESEAPAPTNAAELIELANDVAEFNDTFDAEDDEDEGWEAWYGPRAQGTEHFMLTGSWRWGNSVALTAADGRVWLGEISEARPWHRPASSKGRPDIDGEQPDLETAIESHLLRHPSLVPWVRWSVTLGAALILGALSAAIFADSSGPLDVLVTMLYSIIFLIGWPILAGAWFEGMVMRSGRGIRYLGVLHDEQLGPDDVWGVEAATTGDAVAIGITDDARAFAARQVADPRVEDPDSAAKVLREWLRQGRGSGGRSLTPGAWASMLLLIWVIWLTVSNLVS